MGIPVLIIGESGSGKSTSLRNFEADEIGIFNVASKPLPFQKQLPKFDGATYGHIIAGLEKPKLLRYVIDDSQYLMAFTLFDKAKETGYQKYSEIAVSFKNLIYHVIQKTPPDVVVYFLHHSETTDTGKIKAKTVGKMLDNHLTVEGLFSIVLLATASDTGYKFITQSDGNTTAKSPLDMFERDIDNDLKFVDNRIRDYWGLKTNIENGGTKE